jgi:GNAT superfamily N-acetyltransferase
VLPADVALTPVIERDFQELRQLADRIWRQHYTGMISTAQIDHMLDRRFSDDALRTYLQTATSWLELLRVAGSAVGYCGCAVVAEEPQSLKLDQLYLLDSHRGMGLGRFMLSHIERRAENLGLHTIVLQVNKRNEAAFERGTFRRRGDTTALDDAETAAEAVASFLKGVPSPERVART